VVAAPELHFVEGILPVLVMLMMMELEMDISLELP
jgi:hypothetical protein